MDVPVDRARDHVAARVASSSTRAVEIAADRSDPLAGDRDVGAERLRRRDDQAALDDEVVAHGAPYPTSRDRLDSPRRPALHELARLRPRTERGRAASAPRPRRDRPAEPQRGPLRAISRSARGRRGRAGERLALSGGDLPRVPRGRRRAARNDPGADRRGPRDPGADRDARRRRCSIQATRSSCRSRPTVSTRRAAPRAGRLCIASPLRELRPRPRRARRGGARGASANRLGLRSEQPDRLAGRGRASGGASSTRCRPTASRSSTRPTSTMSTLGFASDACATSRRGGAVDPPADVLEALRPRGPAPRLRGRRSGARATARRRRRAVQRQQPRARRGRRLPAALRR